MFTSQCKRNGSGETGKKCYWIAVGLPTWLLFLRPVMGSVTSPLLTDLWHFCQVSQSLWSVRVSGGRPELEQVYARFAVGGRTTGGSDWQTDGGKDRKKKDCVKKPSGCETWANVELKQSMTILFYSPLSTWAPEALCDVCVACLCACSAVRVLQRGREEMRDERIEGTLGWAVPSLHPCMQCDFCFMACGCIKPQSNNLVSSGAETPDISHGATTAALYLWASAACSCSLSLYLKSPQLYSVTLSVPLPVTNLQALCSLFFIFSVKAGYLTSILFWYRPKCVRSTKY